MRGHAVSVSRGRGRPLLGDLHVQPAGVASTAKTGATTTITNTYPSAGHAQPHAVTAESVRTADGTTTTNFVYNAAGELTSTTGGPQSQTLTWNDQGQLAQDAVTPAGATTALATSYIYDAGGNLLITVDPGSTTLYLGDEELTLSGGTVTGTRYYALGNTTVATLASGTGVSYLVGDQQGTSAVAISASNLAVTRRYYDPYGNPLGASASFPTGDKGFVGGATDSATGLTDLGVREYQPDTGSFISTDPLLSPYDPLDLNPYAYGADDPATESDPTGASSGPQINGPNGCRGNAKAVLACEENAIRRRAKAKKVNEQALLQHVLSCELYLTTKGCASILKSNIREEEIWHCITTGPRCKQ